MSNHRKNTDGAMTSPKFTGKESILVLTFFTAFKAACDDCGVAEKTSLCIIKHFLAELVHD